MILPTRVIIPCSGERVGSITLILYFAKRLQASMPCLGQRSQASRNEINRKIVIGRACLHASAKIRLETRSSGKLLHRRSGNFSLGPKWARQVVDSNIISCQGFSGVTESSISSAPSLSHLAEYASTVLWVGVFWFAYRMLSQTNDRESQGRECETCGGSGYVECFCTRWSDGDRRGCSSCGGSLQTACHSCGGGGTAVPILGKVYIKNEKDYGM